MTHTFGLVNPHDPSEVRDKLLSQQDLDLLGDINAHAVFHECEVVAPADVPARARSGWFRSLLDWPEALR